MMLKIERLPHEEGESQSALPSPFREKKASVDINVEAAGAGRSEEALPGPPITPIVPIGQQEAVVAQAADLPGVARALNVRQSPSLNVVAKRVRVKKVLPLEGRIRAS